MTTYYVRKTGSDGNAGTSAATAWLTLTHALSAGAGPTGGDTIVVGAGVYRETVSCGLTSPTSTLTVAADTDGSQTGDAGEVRLTAYTTDDATAPSSTALLNSNGKHFLAWQRFVFQGGATTAATLGAVHDWTFADCAWLSAPGAAFGSVSLTTIAGTASNVLFDRCRFLQTAPAAVITILAALTSADYACAITVRNCLFLHPSTGIASTSTTGSGTGKPSGLAIQHCTFSGGNSGVSFSSTTFSATTASTVTWCLFATTSAASISAGASGQLTENWNRFLGTAARTNVTAGANSVSATSPAAGWHAGQELTSGAILRPFLTPAAGSPLLGAISDGTDTLAVDLLNRPRPGGGVSANRAFGALERHDTGTQVTTPVHGTTTHSLQLAGPSDHEFALPVDAVAQTPSIWAQYDASYGAGTKPQAILTNGGECGVADQTLTMTAVGAGTWQQLTFASFTPAAKGVLTIRLVSNAASSGNAYFGDMAP